MAITDSLPAPVADAWRTLLATAAVTGEPSPAETARWAALDACALDLPVDDAAGAWVARELEIIEAAERLQAWADAQALSALRRLHEGVGLVVREHAALGGIVGGPLDGPMAYAAVVSETTTATVDEVALATGLPETQVAARLALALTDGERTRPLGDGLRVGAVGLDRALRVHQATSELDPDIARAVTERLLAPMADGSVRSHRSFVRELRRQVLSTPPTPRRAGPTPCATGRPSRGSSPTAPAVSSCWVTAPGSSPRSTAWTTWPAGSARLATSARSPSCARTSRSTSCSTAGPTPPTSPRTPIPAAP